MLAANVNITCRDGIRYFDVNVTCRDGIRYFVRYLCVCVLIRDIVCVVVRRERLILFVRCLLAADLAPTWYTIYR